VKDTRLSAKERAELSRLIDETEDT